MRIKQICVVMLVLFASVGIEMRSIRAQVTSQPPKPTAFIPLEMIGDPGGGAPPPPATSPQPPGIPGGVPWVDPSRQAANGRGSAAKADLSQLRNPFDGGQGQQPIHRHVGDLNSCAPTVYPSPQGPSSYGRNGGATLDQLRNPFDGGQGQQPIHRHVGDLNNCAPTVYPSPQGPSAYGRNGVATLGQLRNPFDGGASQGKKGLFDYASPQYSTGQAVGGTMPGGPMSPGTVPGPTTPSTAPGATAPGTAPGATTPDTTPGATTPSPTPGAETTPGEGAAGTTTPPAGSGAAGAGAPASDAFGAAATNAGPGYGGALEAAVTPFAMIGDLSPISIHALATNAATNPGPPTPPGPRGASPIYAAARNVKISENQSPRPQDRIYFNFNYYNNVNDTINRRDLSPVTQMKVYTYLFGIEKTFNEGKGSIGIRVPLDNLTANSYQNVLSTPTSTAAGNLSIIAKYILEQNVKTGSLISAGLAITAPTGPSRFAGAPYLFPLNSVYFQPYLGYIYNYNRWYIQGFSGFNFTSNINDVSYVFNDIGLGYYLYRDEAPQAFLSAVAPTFELHVNNPINHRDVFNRYNLAAMPDTVDLTFGLNLQIRHAAVLTFAYVAPVASPKPFDSEAAVLLNIFYGRTRAGLIPITPPPAL